MIRAVGSLLFYGRFLRSFSALGFRRRARDWPEFHPDFSGQTWLVTGATGGIGRAVSLAAVEAGATVVAAARSEDKLETLRNESDDPKRLIPLCADLSLMAEIAAVPDGDALAGRTIDVLVNNVGVLLDDFETTDEGVERSFATNLLGHWVLTTRLRDNEMLAEDGLVVEVSSGGMYGTALKLDPMDCRTADDHDGMAAYAMHKRAQVELTRYWNGRWKGGPIAHVMHPGWVDTEGVKTALPGFRAALKRILRTPEQGADTILWLADEYPEPVQEGIWFDRALRPEHEFGFTKKTRHDADELAAFLEEKGRKVLG